MQTTTHWFRMAGSKYYHLAPHWPASGRSACGQVDLTHAGWTLTGDTAPAGYRVCERCKFSRAQAARRKASDDEHRA